MAHIIVTGATGLAGSAFLAECLASPAIAKVSILSRRPAEFAKADPKAHIVIHSGYSSYPSSALEQIRGATGCIWAQGKSSIAMADLPEHGGDFKFVYISDEGADTTEKSSQMFGRVKGLTEKDLLAMATTKPALSVYNLRPGVIDPMGNDPRNNKPFSIVGDLLVPILGPVLSLVYPSMHTPTKSLAEVSVRLAVGDGQPLTEAWGTEADGRTLRNTAIRRFAGL
ncbi:hypothetical protein M436DRAFT_71197 [Aureobasidium namibiae CBS 147.97]|uniref:Nucleoside-diphosphate-sugar epimerase n=1 Tax=Aureobasidium namibiae CBS 147.97 TaxID=1043004 RepID=A0A074WSZ5_9PEZI